MIRLIAIILTLTGALMAVNLPQIYTQKLSNNLEVVAIPMHNNTGVVSVEIIYKVGSRNEVMGKSGLAHMLEHMNFKSTKNMPAGEFDKIVKKLGGINNASTSFDYTRYFIKTSTRNIDKSLSLFAEMMENLVLDDSEFQPERSVVAEERRWRTDNNPTGFLFFNLFNLAYLNHPYHWTPIGFMDDIQNWKIDDLREFHKLWYQPQNAIVLVSGDLDQESIFKHTKKHFEKIKNRTDLKEIITKEADQNGARRAILHKESEVEMLAIAWRGVAFDSPDSVKLNALASILGDGTSSRLNERLKDKEHLVNSISVFNMDLKDEGLFIIIAACNSGVEATKVEKIILEEIELLKKKAPTKEELDKVKIASKAEFVYALESSDSVSRLYGDFLARGNIKPLLEYEKSLEALKPKDIESVANKYLNSRTSTTLILKKGD